MHRCTSMWRVIWPYHTVTFRYCSQSIPPGCRLVVVKLSPWELQKFDEFIRHHPKRSGIYRTSESGNEQRKTSYPILLALWHWVKILTSLCLSFYMCLTGELIVTLSLSCCRGKLCKYIEISWNKAWHIVNAIYCQLILWWAHFNQTTLLPELLTCLYIQLSFKIFFFEELFAQIFVFNLKGTL